MSVYRWGAPGQDGDRSCSAFFALFVPFYWRAERPARDVNNTQTKVVRLVARAEYKLPHE